MKVLTYLLAGGAGVALTACSFSVGGKSLVQEDVESEISTGLSELVGGEIQSINCDGVSDVDVEAGSTFTCTGVDAPGNDFTVEGELTDDEGSFSYEITEVG